MQCLFLQLADWVTSADCSIVIFFSLWSSRGRDWIFHSCLSRPLTCSSSKVVLIQFTSCRPLLLWWLITVQTRGEPTFSHATTAKLWSTVLVWCQSGLEDSWFLLTREDIHNVWINFGFTLIIHKICNLYWDLGVEQPQTTNEQALFFPLSGVWIEPHPPRLCTLVFSSTCGRLILWKLLRNSLVKYLSLKEFAHFQMWKCST